MKKTAFALTAVLITSIMIGVQSIKLVEANPYIIARAAPNISLDSPLNMTYAENVLLNFTVTASESWLTGDGHDTPFGFVQELLSVDYYIDGSLRGSIVADSNLSSPFHYSASLTGLREGSHCLMVNTNSKGFEGSGLLGAHYVPANSSSVTVYFNLMRDMAADTVPVISIISPANKTYVNEVMLHLNVSAVSDYQKLSYVGYTLDGRNHLVYNDQGETELKRALNWSTTLIGLTEGTHTLKVIVSLKDYFDVPATLTPASYQICSGSSDTISFTVASPFPTTLVIASVIAVAVVGIGLLVYFKKRKQ